MLVAVALLAVGSAGASPHPAPRIVFLSDWVPHFRTSELYAVSRRGGRSRNLTENKLDDIDPSWAPDGKRFVFAGKRRGSFDLYLMNAGGGRPRRLLSLPGDQRQPAWSPDGRMIAFVNGDVWSCDPDGCYEEGLSAIATIRASGGRRHYVTRPLVRLGTSFGAPQRFMLSDGATFFGVRWSPDGRELLYARRLDEGTLDLFSIAPGGAPRRLTASTGIETNAVTSPDGRHVMFARYPLGAVGPRVFVMNVRGGGLRELAGHGYVGSWSPDSRRVAFVVQNGERPPRIYVADADGSDPHRLV